MEPPRIESLSALTLATRNMRRAVVFYTRLGFELKYGGEEAAFTSFGVGDSYLNLVAQPSAAEPGWWGRAIFYVSDVDELYARAMAAGYRPEAPPRDAPWGERFFHILDPDGHELSFAKPLSVGGK